VVSRGALARRRGRAVAANTALRSTRTTRHRWLAVAGARPNFMKLAPLVAAARSLGIALPWVHTGQHYDAELSDGIFADLGLRAPVESLAIGAGSPSTQTARILERLEPVLARRRPDVVIVVGDVTSTLAAALAAVQAGIPVAHVEAGLRSFDESMPEERNRVLVDHMSARLYVTEPSGVENLRREGIDGRRVRLVGNPMIDALRRALPAIERRDACAALAKRERGRAGEPQPPRAALVTLHRPSNVDDPRRLARWCEAFARIATSLPVCFPVHPRTRARLEDSGLDRSLVAAGVALIPPLSYVEFLSRVRAARVVLTDSGGIQEEASFLGVPCLTLRTTTERPMTLTHGTNRLVGDDPRRLAAAVEKTLRRPPRARPQRRPPKRLWDGNAAARIVTDLRRFA
jgi:UDP-N-acetylglucosamine 2-epimerase (non-hydrolysing)